jgi:hypothetical protein
MLLVEVVKIAAVKNYLISHVTVYKRQADCLSAMSFLKPNAHGSRAGCTGCSLATFLCYESDYYYLHERASYSCF